MNLLARRSVAFFSAFVFALLPVGTSLAQEDMAKQSQNPLGTIISSPFENTFLFGIGPSNATAYMLNWKPVYPVSLGSWNLINRFIVPVVYSEGQDEDVLLESTLNVGNTSLTEMAAGSAFGLADITYTAYLSPKDSGSWIWIAIPVTSGPRVRLLSPLPCLESG